MGLVVKKKLDMPSITNIRFVNRPQNSDVDENCLGFVTFVFDEKLSFKSVFVYHNMGKKGCRFVYPFDPKFRRTYVAPININTGNWITKKLNEALKTIPELEKYY